jgi:hypothetical protein
MDVAFTSSKSSFDPVPITSRQFCASDAVSCVGIFPDVTCVVRSKTARSFPAGLIVTGPARFPLTTCSWREWIGELQIISEEDRRKLRVKNDGLVYAGLLL